MFNDMPRTSMVKKLNIFPAEKENCYALQYNEDKVNMIIKTMQSKKKTPKRSNSRGKSANKSNDSKVIKAKSIERQENSSL